MNDAQKSIIHWLKYKNAKIKWNIDKAYTGTEDTIELLF